MERVKLLTEYPQMAVRSQQRARLSREGYD